MSEGLHTVETYFFSQDGQYILLDVRQSRFFTITPLEREILAAPAGTPMERLRAELRRAHEDAEISRALERLRERHILLPQPASPAEEAKALAFPPITNLALNVAQDCNLRCRYCFVEQGSFGARRQMSKEVARQAVDLLLRESGPAATCRIGFSGGEPLLNFELIRDTVTYGQEQAARHGKRMSYLITTNGTLLNDDHIAFIKKHGIQVRVSLDGPPAVHDRLRSTAAGQGSYDVVVAGLSRLLADCAEQVSIRATLTHHSPPVSELLDYLAGFRASQMILKYVMGNDEDYALDQATRERMKAEYTKLARRFLAGAPVGDLSAAGFFVRYLDHFCSGRKRRIGCDCGAGADLLGVSASGNIYPCPNLAEREEYRLGHVAMGLDREKLVNWRSYLDVDRKPVCQSCWARYICGGGCLTWAVKFRGTPRLPVDAECDLVRHLIQLAIWVHLELRDRHPQVFLSALPVLGLDLPPAESVPMVKPPIRAGSECDSLVPQWIPN